MKLAVVGSRTFTDYQIFCDVLDSVLEVHGGMIELISGGAKGADSLAKRYANDAGIDIKIFAAHWDEFGKGAGMIRNTDIVKECDQLLAFWDGKSRGTLDSITKAVQAKKFVMIQGF
jgi:hypothetical protein